jgi:hypothetical protein
LDKIYQSAKDKIDEGLAKLNAQPLTADNACQYKELTEALYYLITASSMLDYSEDGYSGYNDYSRDDRSMGLVHMPKINMPPMSRDGRRGMDGDNDGRYNESGRYMPNRYYYSGHVGKEHMMQDLKAMMADADSEKERRRIKDLIEDLEEMK